MNASQTDSRMQLRLTIWTMLVKWMLAATGVILLLSAGVRFFELRQIDNPIVYSLVLGIFLIGLGQWVGVMGDAMRSLLRRGSSETVLPTAVPLDHHDDDDEAELTTRSEK